ncbi:MAG: hypothetical protein EOM68_13790 [Spirochaetia bacterium]|nr:hypothetical protein [Spirochaetia bacterium]
MKWSNRLYATLPENSVTSFPFHIITTLVLVPMERAFTSLVVSFFPSRGAFPTIGTTVQDGVGISRRASTDINGIREPLASSHSPFTLLAITLSIHSRPFEQSDGHLPNTLYERIAG